MDDQYFFHVRRRSGGLRPLTSLLAFGAPLRDTSVALRYFFDGEDVSCPGHNVVKSLSYGVFSGSWPSVAEALPMGRR